MKKILVQALIITIIPVLLTGCMQQSTKQTSAGSTVLRDGTYTSIGESEISGWFPEISITIDNNKITDVKYDEFSAVRKSNNIEYQNSFKAQTNLDLLEVYNSLQNSLIQTQDASKIDTVTGATMASTNFKSLASEALKNAKEGTQYIDGDYTAQGTMDEKYWTPVINISVKNGKIAAVTYDEISSKVFKYKSLDKAHVDTYKQNSSIDLLEVYDNLQKSLIEKQDPSKIDVIAGATETSRNFIEAAKQAVEEAK